ncbi:MAG: hypothetical protein HN733_00515 [Gammaproteobacteria bacterium]|jgi:hypothetical protein|nr:hypothetical protein [Gammaproteobacteria bacterium]
MNNEKITKMLYDIEQSTYTLRALLQEKGLAFKAESIINIISDIRQNIASNSINELKGKKDILLG